MVPAPDRGGPGLMREITEIKHTLDGAEHRFRCRLVARSADHAVLHYVHPAAAVVGSMTLPEGSETLAHYWPQRPYVAYHWLDGQGRTLGIYLNAAAEVEIHGDAVQWLDLALDVLVTASGEVEVLDEDEARAAPEWARPALERAQAALLVQAPAIADEVRRLTAATGGGRPDVRRSPEGRRE